MRTALRLLRPLAAGLAIAAIRLAAEPLALAPEGDPEAFPLVRGGAAAPLAVEAEAVEALSRRPLAELAGSVVQTRP